MQYFLGSSHMWEDHIGAGESVQLVPLEIALKVASQIRAHQPFAAYIMLPMWPEGAPLPLLAAGAARLARPARTLMP